MNIKTIIWKNNSLSGWGPGSKIISAYGSGGVWELGTGITFPDPQMTRRQSLNKILTTPKKLTKKKVRNCISRSFLLKLLLKLFYFSRTIILIKILTSSIMKYNVKLVQLTYTTQREQHRNLVLFTKIFEPWITTCQATTKLKLRRSWTFC